MKLENCGRCGLEPEYPADGAESFVRCPACGLNGLDSWNRDQFRFKTERINAAAVAICATDNNRGTYLQTMTDAEVLITAQDAAARSRWAEMQKGGE